MCKHSGVSTFEILCHNVPRVREFQCAAARGDIQRVCACIESNHARKMDISQQSENSTSHHILNGQVERNSERPVWCANRGREEKYYTSEVDTNSTADVKISLASSDKKRKIRVVGHDSQIVQLTGL